MTAELTLMWLGGKKIGSQGLPLAYAGPLIRGRHKHIILRTYFRLLWIVPPLLMAGQDFCLALDSAGCAEKSGKVRLTKRTPFGHLDGGD